MAAVVWFLGGFAIEDVGEHLGNHFGIFQLLLLLALLLAVGGGVYNSARARERRRQQQA